MNILFICSNIPAVPVYQLIHYFRAFGYYPDFLERVAVNKEATEPRVSCGQIEVIIAKVLQSPS